MERDLFVPVGEGWERKAREGVGWESRVDWEAEQRGQSGRLASGGLRRGFPLEARAPKPHAPE